MVIALPIGLDGPVRSLIDLMSQRRSISRGPLNAVNPGRANTYRHHASMTTTYYVDQKQEV